MILVGSQAVVEPITTERWYTPGLHAHRKSMAHMAFYWGHKTEVLFPGWPGSSSTMYAVALLLVFALAVVVEWLGNCKLIEPGANRVATGMFKTALHSVRAGLVYMVMLSVMSFNGGIFIAAILGHAVGFLLFGSRVFKRSGESGSASQKPPAT